MLNTKTSVLRLILVILVFMIITLKASRSSGAPESSAPYFKGDRAFAIVGPIGNDNTTAIGVQMVIAAATNKDPIELVINSPGGSATTGYKFVGMMKEVQAKGVEIRCFVLDYAVSMAFAILNECDKRYALKTSLLMFHFARVHGGVYTEETALDMHLGLKMLNRKMLQDLTLGLKPLTPNQVRRSFYREKFWTGDSLSKATNGSFIKAYSFIPGLVENIATKKIPINDQIRMEGIQKKFPTLRLHPVSK
jgi:ATP-dependent protease ClpP protease subunit